VSTRAPIIVEMIWLSMAMSEPIRALEQIQHRVAIAVDRVTAPPMLSDLLLCEGSSGIRLDNTSRCVGQTGYDSVAAEFTLCQQSDNSAKTRNSTILQFHTDVTVRACTSCRPLLSLITSKQKGRSVVSSE